MPHTLSADYRIGGFENSDGGGGASEPQTQIW